MYQNFLSATKIPLPLAIPLTPNDVATKAAIPYANTLSPGL